MMTIARLKPSRYAWLVLTMSAMACGGGSGGLGMSCGGPAPSTSAPPAPSVSVHTPIGQLPAVDLNALLAHTKKLSSDEFEGRAPGTTRRGSGGELPGRPVQGGRVEAGQHRRDLLPAGAAGRHHADAGAAGVPQRRPGADAEMERRRGRVDQARAPIRRRSRTPSSCSSATAWSRPSSTGTTTRASTSRARRSSCWSTIRRCPIPPTPSELDPKTFGGKAMTYYGRWTYKYEMAAQKGAAGALIIHETGAGRLRLQRRAGQDRRAVRPRHARQEHGPRRDRRLDHAGFGQSAAEVGRPGFRRAEEEGGHARLQAGAARRDRVDDDCQQAADDQLAERAREARGVGSETEGRVRRLHRALGSFRQDRRRHLPRRRGRWAGMRGADRDGARVHEAADAAAALDSVPRGDRRGAGAARFAVLLGLADLSAGEDRRRHQHGQLEHARPHQGHDA